MNYMRASPSTATKGDVEVGASTFSQLSRNRLTSAKRNRRHGRRHGLRSKSSSNQNTGIPALASSVLGTKELRANRAVIATVDSAFKLLHTGEKRASHIGKGEVKGTKEKSTGNRGGNDSRDVFSWNSSDKKSQGFSVHWALKNS